DLGRDYVLVNNCARELFYQPFPSSGLLSLNTEITSHGKNKIVGETGQLALWYLKHIGHFFAMLPTRKSGDVLTHCMHGKDRSATYTLHIS
ncbi:unnamed protein product, partial [Amoebophrya sp. A25]